MNTKINKMHFKQTLLAIVLMVAFLPAFGSPVEWRGRYTGGSYLEGPKRFRPSLNHRNTSVWILDSEQPFDFGSAWVLYKLSPNTPKWKPEQDLLDLYFSPPWRQVDTVIVEGKGVIEY